MNTPFIFETEEAETTSKTNTNTHKIESYYGNSNFAIDSNEIAVSCQPRTI